MACRFSPLATILSVAVSAVAIPGCGSEEPREASALTWSFDESPRGIDFVYTFGDDEFSFILEDTGSGAAVLDYDGDGWLDVYLLNGTWLDGVSDPAARANAEARNQLYRNLGDGHFENVTEAAGVGDTGYGMGAVVGDADGDGDEDLYVLNYGPNAFYRNLGDGHFEDATAATGLAGPARLGEQTKWSVNGFFFDYDTDGDLDLYVANYLAFDPEFVDPNLPPEYPYPGPESYPGQASQLYRNDNGRFTDVTEAAGLLKPGGKTMGANFADLDGDGDLDIFEAVDDMQNFLFENQGDGTFKEIAVEAGVAFDRSGKTMASMHASIGDIDADGDLDVFVPDLEFGCLYVNQGGMQFSERGREHGLPAKDLGSGWGSSFEDFDNDGILDLVVVLGGAFSLEGGEADRLFTGNGEGRFIDRSAILGATFANANVSRGAAFGDLDNDGDIDLVINRKDVEGSPNVVFNRSPDRRNWLTVRLVGTRSNGEGIGARVELTVDGVLQVRTVGRSGSYLSQSDVRAHFGLGGSDQVERLVVRWPSGTVQEVEVDEVNQIVVVTETPED